MTRASGVEIGSMSERGRRARPRSRPESVGTEVRPDCPVSDAVREHVSALAHGDAYDSPKKAAYRLGRTARTARRWASPHEAKGSPQDTYTKYLEAADDPWRLVAMNEVTATYRTVRRWSREKLISKYRELLAEGPHVEAADASNGVKRGVTWLERASASERDAAHDMLKAAIERRLAVLGVSEAEVFAS